MHKKLLRIKISFYDESHEKEAGLDIIKGHFENTKDFREAYKQGFIQGVKDSGSDWKHLATEFVKHPFATTSQVIDAFRDLSNLVLTDQCGELSEALSSEAYKLATEWNNLSAEERGGLAGYAVGKGGTDIDLAP